MAVSKARIHANFMSHTPFPSLRKDNAAFTEMWREEGSLPKWLERTKCEIGNSYPLCMDAFVS